MKIEETGRDEVMRPILEDENTQTIVDAVAQEAGLRAFLMSVIRDFKDRRELTARNPNLRKLANNYAGSRSERSAADRLCRSIELLYARFDPSNVRGAILEAVVQRAIQVRYGGGSDWLENNIAFRIERDGETLTTSTSVDVLGIDMTAESGECHDCKVRARKVDADWLNELQDKLAPFGFRIGIATADSARVAKREMKLLGGLNASTSVIAFDHWVLPLQP